MSKDRERFEEVLAPDCARTNSWSSAAVVAKLGNSGPEWLRHHCHPFDPEWSEVEPRGRIFSWERVWHPSHAALKQRGPYLAALVELPHARGVRMFGNLPGEPLQAVAIGAKREGEFEHHQHAAPPYSLLQRRLR